MAKKRKSSEGPEASNNATQTRDLKTDFESLCRATQVAGDDSGGELWNTYKFLWWKNLPKLDEAVNGFLRELPFMTVPIYQHSNSNWKLEHLLLKLRPLVAVEKELSRTPRLKQRFKNAYTNDAPEDEGLQAASPSSTSRRRNLTDAFRVSKATMAPPKQPMLNSSSHPPMPTDPAPKKKSLVQTTIPQVLSTPSRPVQKVSNIPAQNVSFKSTTEGNPSFNKTSFWLDIQGTQRTVDTAATSFSEDHPTESTNYGSEISYEKVIGALQQLESSQKSDATEKASQPLSYRAKSDVTSRESETYCSSIDTRFADELQARSDCFYAYNFERRSTIPTRNEYENEDTTGDAQTRITAVKADIYNHEGPCKRQRVDDEPGETGLVQLRLPKQFRKLPFSLQWEVKRVLQTDKITAEELDAEWRPRTVEALFELVSEREISCQHPPRSGPKPLQPWEVYTRNARLEWSTSGTALKMAPQLQRKDTSCSLERKFGVDRVLYVSIPDLSRAPASVKHRNVQDQFFKYWCTNPQTFLGQTWYLYFLKPAKKVKASECRTSTNVATLIFVSPPDGMSIGDIVQWFLPLATNKGQSSRKAYMRLELSVSRTIPVAVLKPEDIAYQVEDKLATNVPDDCSFLDPPLRREFHEHYDMRTVMSDGCNRMSSWIAMQFAAMVGHDKVPPVLQIRVAGSKGLWYIENDNVSSSLSKGKPAGPLIHLAKSQVKVFRETLHGCDDEILTVGVVKPNMGARPSVLHMLFLPILIDRGVPLASIREFVSDQVTQELDGFIQALEAPGGLPFRRWLACREHWFEAIRRDAGIETVAGSPRSTEESVIQMLESGFDPKENAFLARNVKMLAAQYFDLKNRNFTITLTRSTTVWGIADPEDCLEPGEVCLNLGGWFDGQSFRADGREALVARNPALAPWDIQKVRCVDRPQLARFSSMIIFSAKGMRPLANKLQGGDYDGDPYWITWEEKLVADFKNAPAPWSPPPPETFGIQKDRSLLSDHVQDANSDEQWADWLGNMAYKRMSANMLGIVTLFHERLLYGGCPAGDEEAVNIVHCHDYLVDSDKQGYDYDMTSFDEYKKSRSISRRFPNLRNPTYWTITKYTPGEDSKPASRGNVIGEGQVTDNVIDIVFFEVAGPIIERTLERARIVLESAADYDQDLARFCSQTLQSYPQGSDQYKEIIDLKQKLRAVQAEWAAKNWAKEKNALTKEHWMQKVRQQYDAIQPNNPASTTAVEWLRGQGKGLTTWEKLKASAFAGLHSISGTLQFRIAGPELCYLKASEQAEPCRTIVDSQYRALKVRKLKVAWSPDQAHDNMDELDEEPIVETAYY